MNVKYKKEAFCEHCGDLEPFSGTVNSWCISCYENTFDEETETQNSISKEEYLNILKKEIEHKIAYYENKLEYLRLKLSEYDT